MKSLNRGLFTSAGALALTVGLLLTGPQAAWAKKHGVSPTVTDPPVTACGTLSASNTIYIVQNNLTQAGTGDCLLLSGSNDTLDLNGFTITGPGGSSTGAGLDITGSEDVVEGFDTFISGFAEGVLDVGTDTSGDQVNETGNAIGLELTSTGGFFGTGSTQMWSNFSADTNTKQGVFLNACADECTITEFDASGNGADGVLVQGSAGPRISIFTLDSNGGAGLHVGCTSGCGSNSTVKIVDAPIGFNTPPAVAGNAGDGIFLDASESSTKDQVTLVKASGNGGVDLHDASTTCGSNHWVHNDYGTASAHGVSNPACIPNVPF